VPVAFSFTSTTATMRSSELPFLVVISTVSKNPSAVMRCLEILMALAL